MACLLPIPEELDRLKFKFTGILLIANVCWVRNSGEHWYPHAEDESLFWSKKINLLILFWNTRYLESLRIGTLYNIFDNILHRNRSLLTWHQLGSAGRPTAQNRVVYCGYCVDGRDGRSLNNKTRSSYIQPLMKKTLTPTIRWTDDNTWLLLIS